MPNYQNGKIYAIRSYLSDDVYYGSTCDSLAKRLYGHRRDHKRYQNEKFHYVTSFKLIERADHYIELVENYPCNDKGELMRREGEIIRANTCVNRCIAGRTKAEYRQDNAEDIKQKNKQYKLDNAEVIAQKAKQYNKQYRQENAEVIKQHNKQYRQDNAEVLKQYIKQYRQDNAEVIKQKNKQYRQDNADAINHKHTCDCGGKYTTKNKLKHMKTKKHKEHEAFLSLTEEEVRAMLA